MDVFNQVNKIVKRKEQKKRKLIKEARRLQREAEEQVGLLRDIQRIEEEYEQQLKAKVRELERQIEMEKSEGVGGEEEDEEDVSTNH